MLTVAYCRVSTEEQATEGFSIEGQAERLRQYADLHELGPVVVIVDPGRSGKDLHRPGLLQLLQMVDDGHVAHVLIWRLDRLSRNLGDLIGLADRFGQANVSLHSFTEKLDLSSATGRMFYNILGAFAQFYREQLSENVRLGMRQAGLNGYWTNRPPTGYDLVDGVLTPNADADLVRQVFRLRAEGLSQAAIASRVGTTHSLVVGILGKQAYLGKVKVSGEWLTGRHEPLVTEQEFKAAHRGHRPGIRRGKDLMSGRVRCGQCGRAMSVMDNGAGWLGYRCRHRGQGCDTPRFSNKALLRSALLGLELVRTDSELQAAIRSSLTRRQADRKVAGRRDAERRHRIAELEANLRKLFELYYAESVSPAAFQAEEQRINEALDRLRAADDPAEPAEVTQLDQFEALLSVLAELDWERIWDCATDSERRILLDEFVPGVSVFPDHLEVQVRGAPRLNVALHEVGLRGAVENGGVGGPSDANRYWSLATDLVVPEPAKKWTGRRQTVLATGGWASEFRLVGSANARQPMLRLLRT